MTWQTKQSPIQNDIIIRYRYFVNIFHVNLVKMVLSYVLCRDNGKFIVYIYRMIRLQLFDTGIRIFVDCDFSRVNCYLVDDFG